MRAQYSFDVGYIKLVATSDIFLIYLSCSINKGSFVVCYVLDLEVMKVSKYFMLNYFLLSSHESFSSVVRFLKSYLAEDVEIVFYAQN